MLRKLLTALCFFAIATSAYALDLGEARELGYVGEKQSGYTEVLQAKPGVEALSADINSKRRAEYHRISGENGQPVDVVAKIAAQQIITKLPAGAYYQADDGSWKRR